MSIALKAFAVCWATNARKCWVYYRNVSFDDGEVLKLFAEYLRRGKLDGEFVFRHKDGNPVPIRYRVFVFADGCNAAVWEPVEDWQELYLSALVEIDPAKLKHKAEIALLAVQQRT